MTDQTDPAPPATTPAKTRDDYYREWGELDAIAREMLHYAPSKLAGATLVLRSLLNANTEDSQ